jgi:hypothetical protein
MIYSASENRYETMQYNRCGKSGLKLPAASSRRLQLPTLIPVRTPVII